MLVGSALYCLAADLAIQIQEQRLLYEHLLRLITYVIICVTNLLLFRLNF